MGTAAAGKGGIAEIRILDDDGKVKRLARNKPGRAGSTPQGNGTNR